MHRAITGIKFIIKFIAIIPMRKEGQERQPVGNFSNSTTFGEGSAMFFRSSHLHINALSCIPRNATGRLTTVIRSMSKEMRRSAILILKCFFPLSLSDRLLPSTFRLQFRLLKEHTSEPPHTNLTLPVLV